MIELAADVLVPGTASGRLAVLSAPLSLWGGFDVHTGTIVEVTHPERGAELAGTVLAMRETRGSSSSASALVEAARRGKAPAAIVLGKSDPILIIGALIAADLYDIAIPVVVLSADRWHSLGKGGAMACIDDERSTLTLG